MNIKYNEVEKTIEINDGLKTHYLMIKVIMVLNLINAVLNLMDISKTSIGYIEVVWIVLGLISIVGLYMLYFKISGVEKITLEKIKGLEEKLKYGKKQYYLQLTDGKTRSLREVKTDNDVKALRKLFAKTGLKF